MMEVLWEVEWEKVCMLLVYGSTLWRIQMYSARIKKESVPNIYLTSWRDYFVRENNYIQLGKYCMSLPIS